MFVLAGASLFGALGLDWAFGDPPNKFHPVAWIGALVGRLVPRLKAKHRERLRGALFAVLVVGLVSTGTYFVLEGVYIYAGGIAFVVSSALVLKVAIAVRGMERHAGAIMEALKNGDLAGARNNLSMIVRRDTRNLDEGHILSATIECIGESTVDGICGPIFYFTLFGGAGALAYRTINTLDSMVGYKDEYYSRIGWLSAWLDTAANYVPARITALLMVVSARILGADWKNSLYVMARDHRNTASPNAGFPMASMAGALRIRLEKIDHYSLGDGQEPATLEKCNAAIAIMKLTTVLFCFAFSLPLMFVLYYAGWWGVLFS
ncbi:MAG: cobalamin biosynthesis protein [Nitrososphaera sp.]|jgi:adenosylcobinamide-phosphate synthase